MTDGFKVPGDFRCDTGTVVDEGTVTVVSSLVVYSHSGVSALLYEQSDVHPSRVVPLGSSSSSPTPLLYFSASIRIFFVCYFWCLKKQRWTEKVFASPRSVWRDQHLEQSGSLWRKSGENVDFVNKQSTNHSCFKISHRKKERKKHQGVSLSDIVFIERKKYLCDNDISEKQIFRTWSVRDRRLWIFGNCLYPVRILLSGHLLPTQWWF